MIAKVSAYVREHALNAFSGVQGAAIFTPALRRALFRMAGYKLGGDVRINQGVFIGARDIVFGSDVLVGARCHLGGGGRIVLGDGVTLSPNVSLTTSTHTIGGPAKRCGEHHCADIVVERGCWIGIGAVILPGVTIGTGAVVAAGSVVTRSLPPNGLYAGAPARLVREVDNVVPLAPDWPRRA
jgi:maltose O-acetyltransferase